MITLDDVIALINSPEVQGIRFVAESVLLSGGGYSDLIPKLRSGKLQIVSSAAVAGNPSHFAAWYNPRTNSLTVGPTNALRTPNEKANIVHELAHAVVDNQNLPASRGLSRTETEGIAYIAQQIYWHNAGFPVPAQWSHALFTIADKIARNAIASKKLYTVAQDEIRLLRDTIAHDPAYRINPITGRPMSIRGQRAVSDGI